MRYAGPVLRHLAAACALGFSTLLALGCGSATTEVETPQGPVEPPKPRDAAQIAQGLIHGRVGALVYVDRVRFHSAAPKFLEIGPIREVLEGTSVDPLRDIERAFVCGPNASDKRAIVFAEHTVPEDRIPAVVQDMVRKSDPPGEVLVAGPEWRVRVQKRGYGGVVAFIPPKFVVIVPEDLEAGIDAFDGTGGLPDPTGPEAAKLFASQPSESLRARGVPPVPPSISHVTADVFVRSDGGVTIDAIGQSTAEDAPRAAAELTRSIDDATSVGVGFIRIRAFRPMVFRPSGDQVVTHHELSAGEVDTILSLASSFVQ